MPEIPEKFLVDIWVKDYAEADSDEAFYPGTVARDTGLSIRDVFERLLLFVSDGKLVLLWEVRCPVCGETVLRKREVNINAWCSKCKKVVEISPDVVYPLFFISPEYKEHVSKNRFRRLVFSSAFKIQKSWLGLNARR